MRPWDQMKVSAEQSPSCKRNFQAYIDGLKKNAKIEKKL